MTPQREALALSSVVGALLGPGTTRADRAFIVDGRLYKLTVEQIKDEIAMQELINREAGLPSPDDDPYAIDPADMREALLAALVDPNLGAEVADRLALFTESNGYPRRTADAVETLRDVMRWYRERKEVS
ncbi:hypothetical protein MHM84_01075 [Halomonas sp. McH1-25]|uniref:hypothetical protein n=1 Tax=unclassified Halomonas TaxID=2609666 RepID=UPI001EF52B0C|nr:MULTISPECIES: hypothetical protein [unclassified Halomonas]MCG7598373.1 hypothetical protein [Halomonas sp. McH1-25]MCP1342685.1 hypothetical protein [Halomonas sp. FL8]MCP1363085.1 hypothetical protein [Halomonas sp. BBD45]MCP1365572.1 hypothetical protein [Halomonas sp. BBD48]